MLELLGRREFGLLSAAAKTNEMMAKQCIREGLLSFFHVLCDINVDWRFSPLSVFCT